MQLWQELAGIQVIQLITNRNRSDLRKGRLLRSHLGLLFTDRLPKAMLDTLA